MNLKLLFVFFLAASLLVTLSEAGKDRRKKQKQKERMEDDAADDETAGGKAIDDGAKAREEKERSSVLEKQAEKKTDDDESSSEEDEDEKDNSTVIIRKKRAMHIFKMFMDVALAFKKPLTVNEIEATADRILRTNPLMNLFVRMERGKLLPNTRETRAIRKVEEPWKGEEGRVLPTDALRFKRDAGTQIQKTREINDGVQIPLEKKPAATAQPQ